MSEPTLLTGAQDPVRAAQTIAVYVLPALGIIVVAFSLVALARPFGNRLRERNQRFKGFGVDLEMSLLTLVLLSGLLLCFAGMYVITRSYETQLAALAEYPGRLEQAEQAFKEAKQSFEDALIAVRRLDVNALVDLEGVPTTSGAAPPEGLSCAVYLFNTNKAFHLNVEQGLKTNQFKVALQNVTPTTPFVRMECSDKIGRRWFIEQFSPLTPEYHLKLDQ